MTEAGTRATIVDLYNAYGRRNFDRVAGILHDDIDWVIYAPISIFPFAGPRYGRAAVLETMIAIDRFYSLDGFKQEFIIVEGERAALMSDMNFKQRATARTMRFRVANFLRFQDGRLIEFREFSNSFDVVEQTIGRELQV